MYTTAGCGYCDAARAFLRHEGLAVEEIDLAMDARGREALARRTGGRTFPQIVVDGRPIGGYLDLARLVRGGLRSALPPAAPPPAA